MPKEMVASRHTLTAYPSIPLSEEKLTEKCFCGMDSFELPKESAADVIRPILQKQN